VQGRDAGHFLREQQPDLLVAAILGLVGVKMLTSKWLNDFVGPSFNFYLLGIVALILAIGVLASVVVTRREARAPAPTD